MNTIIDKNISRQILMTGVYYKHHHPGGISSVVQYWSEYIEDLQYIPTFKESSNLTKVFVYATSIIRLYFRLLFDRRVKIVHVHTAAGTDFKRSALVIDIAKKKKRKVILHSHASQFKEFYGAANSEQKSRILTALQKADVLIALSESWKEWFEKIGVDSKRITILHNITAYPQVKGATRKAQYPIRFLFLGEIGERKGVFDIIRALVNHKEEFNDKVELKIGGNKREEELRSAIKEGGLENIVSFDGFVSGQKKIDLLNWADVYILPSFNEGLPISILEAMSYSMPIISTPVGGIPEVVDKSNGILVTPGSDAEIYNAIKHYVEAIDDLEYQGKESFKKVETYLPDYVLNHLKNIYESMI